MSHVKVTLRRFEPEHSPPGAMPKSAPAPKSSRTRTRAASVQPDEPTFSISRPAAKTLAIQPGADVSVNVLKAAAYLMGQGEHPSDREEASRIRAHLGVGD
jgi:hypothetical protein